MDFRIATASLQQAVKTIGIVARLNTTDSTGLVLISVQDGLVTFTASNNNTISCTFTDVSVKTPGEISIEFGKLKSFVTPIQPWNDEYGSKECHVRLDGDRRKFRVTTSQKHIDNKTSEGNLSLKTFEAHMVRTPPEFGEVAFSLSARLFKDAISKTVYAIDQNDSRPFLQCICMNFDASKVSFVGTNGRMLSEFRIEDIIRVGSMKEGSVLFKYDFLMAVSRAVSKDVMVDFSIDKDHMKAKFDNVYICGSSVIGREYPEYIHLFDAYEHEIVVGKDILMDSMRSMVDLLNSEDNFRLSFQIEDKKLKLFCDLATFDYSDNVDFEGKFSMDINGQYFMRTVEAIMDDKVVLRFSDEDKASIKMDSFNYGNQRSLVTPLKKR